MQVALPPRTVGAAGTKACQADQPRQTNNPARDGLYASRAKALWHLQHTDKMHAKETQLIWARNGPLSNVRQGCYNYTRTSEKARIRNFPFFDMTVFTHSNHLYEHYTRKKTEKNPETPAAQGLPGA